MMEFKFYFFNEVGKDVFIYVILFYIWGKEEVIFQDIYCNLDVVSMVGY